MGWTELSNFNFDARENVPLFFKRRGWINSAVLSGVLLAALLVGASMVDPNWSPHGGRGKGAAVLALLALLPVAIRGILVAVVIGYLGELVFRETQRTRHRRPDYVIGPTGIACLDPWAPRVLHWNEIRQYRRWVTRRFVRRGTTLVMLGFAAPRRPPRWMPQWLWGLLPTEVTTREIAIAPASVGLTEDALVGLVQRFAGTITTTDYYWTVD